MSIYKSYDTDQLEELASNFLIESWSYSKVSEFSRNEKAFEMSSIYGYRAKSSASTVAGQAYHNSLERYFDSLKDGIVLDIVFLQQVAYDHIETLPAYRWKIQKTTPTIEECKLKAVAVANQLISNFLKESDVYLGSIDQIIDVEIRCEEWITVNGVDIPLPCHAMIDLVVKTKDGKIAIIDHKSKAAFSDQDELQLTIGRQAMTYVLCYEAKKGITIDEVWFVENKYSQNRDKSPQLSKFQLSIDSDVRKLYESLLYEPLKRMVSAVSDPDYVYMINDQDNYIDKAEIYAFWTKTMIAEIDEFYVPESKKEMIAKRMKKIRDSSVIGINPKIIKNFRENANSFIKYDLSDKDMTEKEKIEHTLRSFGIIVDVAKQFDGYSSNTYLLDVSAGVKITSIHSHKLDIANALNVSSVRISKDLVLHDGKSYVSVEFAKKRDKDLIFDKKSLIGMRIPIGMDNFNNIIYWDLENHSTPHMLICGATGSGKSVCIKSTIEYCKLAGVEKIVILDPKFEFMNYSSSKGVSVYNDIEGIEEQMKILVEEMNDLVRTGKKRKTLVVFDEFADAVSASRSGNELNKYENLVVGTFKDGREKISRELVGKDKSLEENLKILLQKGRSCGFRIISATQRASVKVITGDAKVNFPVQICFRVPKEIDSKVVLDESGAESLSGMGDGLIKSPEYSDVVRFQAFYKP